MGFIVVNLDGTSTRNLVTIPITCYISNNCATIDVKQSNFANKLHTKIHPFMVHVCNNASSKISVRTFLYVTL